MMKKRITRKTIILTAVIGGILLVLTVIGNTIVSSGQMMTATDDAVSEVSSFYLEAMADQRAKTLANLIDSNFGDMEKAVEFIKDQGIKTDQELRDTLGSVKSLLSLDGFALADEDNIVHKQYTTYTGGSRHAFLSEEEMEDRDVSTFSNYGSTKEVCLAAPTPDLQIAGKPYKASFVQFDIREIIDLLAFDDEGRTYFGLYSKNGECLSDTDLGPYIAKNNLFDSIKGILPEDEWNTMHENFSNGVEGDTSFTANGVVETISYVPVENTDWMMAALISESVIHDRLQSVREKSQTLSNNQIIFILLFSGIFFLILFLMLKDLPKKDLEAEKENTRTFRHMANTDSMTGVKNKHAYSDAEAYLNQMIRDGQIEKLGIVVCDINGLKHVNDTLGHAAGDKLIRDASTMICKYFTHGAVYRIGGDEFTVVLQEKGYESMTQVIEEFNRVVEGNIEKNEVVVSIGYSTLTSEDQCVHDVFERADQMMYQRKQQLKAMGAATRS